MINLIRSALLTVYLECEAGPPTDLGKTGRRSYPVERMAKSDRPFTDEDLKAIEENLARLH